MAARDSAMACIGRNPDRLDTYMLAKSSNLSLSLWSRSTPHLANCAGIDPVASLCRSVSILFPYAHARAVYPDRPLPIKAHRMLAVGRQGNLTTHQSK